MSNRIQIRRDSTWNWQTSNPILADGELALEYDTNKVKVGDGGTYWNDLPYMTGHVTGLASVATSGSYYDLSNRPGTLMDIIGGYSSADDMRFLRLNNNSGQIEYSSNFRIVPSTQVSYPAGTAGQDKVGDVAFDDNFIYHCKAEPNLVGTVALGYAGYYNPQEWITLTSTVSNRNTPLHIGDIVTDGTNTATVSYIIEGWPGYNGSRQIVSVNPAISGWHYGSVPTLTVLNAGTRANTDCWSRFPAFGSAPANLSSDGVSGQMAVDSNYIYACTRTNIAEVSASYTTPKATNTPGWPGGNQRNGASTFTVLVTASPTPQVGWILSDGTHQRTITNVANAQASVWGQIIDLTFSGGDIDWTGLDSITIISQPYVSGTWVKAKWFSGSYNDLTDKPTTTVPATSKGVSGNKAGMVAYSSGYFYYCTTDYTDGAADIWVRSAWDQTSWS